MKPLVIGFDKVLFSDVDDTLITFNVTEENLSQAIDIGPRGFERKAIPMFKNIKNLKNARTRGHGVVVWSAGGHKWAAEVIRALGLEAYVDLIVAKPSWYYDDLPVDKWIGPRFFKPENGITGEDT